MSGNISSAARHGSSRAMSRQCAANPESLQKIQESAGLAAKERTCAKSRGKLLVQGLKGKLMDSGEVPPRQDPCSFRNKKDDPAMLGEIEKTLSPFNRVVAPETACALRGR